MRSSISQVAARAGVSTMTVSRVLRGRTEEVAKATHARVMEAVRELRYVPVRSAFQNRHIETKIICVVPHQFTALRHELDLHTLRGIAEATRLHGYDVMVSQRPPTSWELDREEVRFLDRRSDGFIFINPCGDTYTRVLETLIENNIPAVACFNRNVPVGTAWVDPDNQSAIDQAVDILAANGHRHIAFLPSPESQFDAIARSTAFSAAIRRAGLPELPGLPQPRHGRRSRPTPSPRSANSASPP